MKTIFTFICGLICAAALVLLVGITVTSPVAPGLGASSNSSDYECPAESPRIPEKIETWAYSADILCRSVDGTILYVERIKLDGTLRREEYRRGQLSDSLTMNAWLSRLVAAEKAKEVVPKSDR